MLALRRRWQSIDHKLPLFASGLVLLTVVVLGWTAYVRLERALIDSSGRRLFGTARVVAQMVTLTPTRTDSTGRAADETLRQFLRGASSSTAAMKALALPPSPRDTMKVYAALVDTTGRVLLEYFRDEPSAPRWPFSALARGEVRRDTVQVGPLESLAGTVSYSITRPLRDTRTAAAPLVGYVVESRAIGSSRLAKAFRGIIGQDVELLFGQPGTGIWTDLETIAAAPPMRVMADSLVALDNGVAATIRVPSTPWMIWLSMPIHSVLSPARSLLWSVVPTGLLIALISAAVMWRLARGITHPIVQLTAAAENIASDNGVSGMMMPTIVMPADANEVARLRYAFERMAHRVSERQTLELQLRHAQKMEAVGRLAGGVAHDFNNLLTAIRSYSDLMLEDMPVWDPKRSDVLEIRTAAQRAAALTAQLLAFSRKQMLQPRVLDTGVVLNEVQAMLKRLLIEDIKLTVDTPHGLWPVKVDRGQLEQVIVNLAVNARDAMLSGGTLRICAVNDVVLDPIATHHGDVPPGEYVAIRVADSGVGMDATTQTRAFEPFFTTKPMGHGTGLGLATVHGIIAQSGGYITIESQPGQGTTFTVYLPRVHEAPAPRHSGGAVQQRGRDETILLVEDEQAVRTLAHRVLTRAGFRVLESTSPSDALKLAAAHAGEIHLVLSDVVMPEMSGPKLVARVAELCPQARVLFISGYTDDEVIGRGLSNPGMMLLQKPFSAQELVERVRTALDQPVPETQSS